MDKKLTSSSSLEFPCTFPIKAIGKHSAGFQAIMTGIIRRHVPDLDENAVSTRPSSGGKYLALTATFVATSREQLDNLYRELSAHELVLYLL